MASSGPATATVAGVPSSAGDRRRGGTGRTAAGRARRLGHAGSGPRDVHRPAPHPLRLHLTAPPTHLRPKDQPGRNAPPSDSASEPSTNPNRTLHVPQHLSSTASDQVRPTTTLTKRRR